MDAKTCALICAFNEQDAVGDIVRRAKFQLDDVIVVDDGSTDATYEKALNAGAGIIKHQLNRGKGQALRTGFDFCLERGYGRIVTLDADGQHLPEDIPRFSEQLNQGYEVAIGRRDFSAPCVPLFRKLGNKLDSYLLSKILGADVQDPQNGYRMFRRETLEKVLEHGGNSGFPFELEMMVRLVRRRTPIAWVPIDTIYSPNIKSHIRPIKHIKDSASLYLKTFFGIL